jgi:hypothetical protein
MNVLEMMKEDINSVKGLEVEYDFGGSEPIIDTIANVRVDNYDVLNLNGEKTLGKVYAISFSEFPSSFYVMHKDVKLVENSLINLI